MAPHLTERDNFLWLLIALVLLLFLDSVFSQIQSEQGRLLVNISLLLTIVIAVWSLQRGQRGWRNWKIGMTAVIAGLMVGDSFVDSYFLSMSTLLGCFLFLSLSLYLCWRQVLFTGAIDGNKIVGAICIYILLGLVWAFGYLMVEEMFPGSFNGLEEVQWRNNLDQLSYYSMVTLTTLGYGDITPNLPVARFLAYMEAITGIFYTTVLVASLIGVRLAHYPEQSGASAE